MCHNPGGYVGAAITAIPLVKMGLGLIFGFFLILVAFQMTHKALKAEPIKASATVDSAFEKALFKTGGGRPLCNPHLHVHHGFHVDIRRC